MAQDWQAAVVAAEALASQYASEISRRQSWEDFANAAEAATSAAVISAQALASGYKAQYGKRAPQGGYQSNVASATSYSNSVTLGSELWCNGLRATIILKHLRLFHRRWVLRVRLQSEPVQLLRQLRALLLL